MKISISPHARKRAFDRFAFSPRDITNYWHRHVGHYKDVFFEGEGVYNLNVGGTMFSVAYEPTKDEIRIITVNHIRQPYSRMGFLGPVYDSDGKYISYSPQPQSTAPAVYREYDSNHGRHQGPNKNGIGRGKTHAAC